VFAADPFEAATFAPAGCALCTTVLVAGREILPAAVACPCSALLVAAESREAADVVEAEDKPETSPASAAACPKAPSGTEPRVKTSKEPNTSFILSIAVPLPTTPCLSDPTHGSPDALRACELRVYS
jgi:hypothetical protein